MGGEAHIYMWLGFSMCGISARAGVWQAHPAFRLSVHT